MKARPIRNYLKMRMAKMEVTIAVLVPSQGPIRHSTGQPWTLKISEMLETL